MLNENTKLLFLKEEVLVCVTCIWNYPQNSLNEQLRFIASSSY